MKQVWLRPNRRVLLLAMVLPALVAIASIVMAILSASGSGLQITWAVVAAISLLLVAQLVKHYFQPRLARSGDHLLVYLKSGRPFHLPLEVVEVFFLGATDANVPGGGEAGGKVSALVIRLAENTKDWRERAVKPSLGKWDESYVRIYGAWCERLCMGKVGGLNEKLRNAKREMRGLPPVSDSGGTEVGCGGSKTDCGSSPSDCSATQAAGPEGEATCDN